MDVHCELRQDKKLVKVIGQGAVSGGPRADDRKQRPFPAASGTTTVDIAGNYHVTCYTPSDEDNTIVYGFTVHGAGIATPVPK